MHGMLRGVEPRPETEVFSFSGFWTGPLWRPSCVLEDRGVRVEATRLSTHVASPPAPRRNRRPYSTTTGRLGRARPTCTSSRSRPETFRFAHHGANGVYIVTKPDGTAQRFRDKPGSPRQIRLIGRIGRIGPIRRGDPAPVLCIPPGAKPACAQLQVDRGNEERGAGLRTAAGQLRRYQHSWSRIGSDSRVKTCEEIWAGQKERESIGGCQG